MKKVLMILLGIALVFSMTGAGMAAPTLEDDVETASGTYFAEGENGGLQNDGYMVEVFYSESKEKYTIWIPNEIEFTAPNTPIETEVKVTDLTLAHGRSLSVNVSSTHDFQLVRHQSTSGGADQEIADSEKLPYTMGYKLNGDGDLVTLSTDSFDADTNDVGILAMISGTAEESTPLTFTLIDTPSTLATYKDILTFKVKVTGDIPSNAATASEESTA